MDQMLAQCAALFKVSTKVVKGLSDFCVFVLSVSVLSPSVISMINYKVLDMKWTAMVFALDTVFQLFQIIFSLGEMPLYSRL